MRSQDVFHKMGVITVHWFSASHKWGTFGRLPAANLMEIMDRSKLQGVAIWIF